MELALYTSFAFGWFSGCLVMWGFFKYSKLIRSREEWGHAVNKTRDWI